MRMLDEFPQDDAQADESTTPEPDEAAVEPDAPLPAAINASDEDGDGVVEKHEVHVTDASDVVEGSGEPEYVAPEAEEVQNETTEPAEEAVADEPTQDPDLDGPQGHEPTASELADGTPESEDAAAEEQAETVDPLDPPEPTPADEPDPTAPTVATQAIVDAATDAAESDEDAAPTVQPSPETLALPDEQRDELIERAAGEEVDVADLPASQQSAAARPDLDKSEVPGSKQQLEALGANERNEQAPLQQRPVEELDEQTYSAAGVLTDDGTRVDPGDYHKPGAALPPETEADQQISWTPEAAAQYAETGDLEGTDEAHNAAQADATEEPAPVEPEEPVADEPEAPEVVKAEYGDFDGDGDQDVREVE